MVLGYLTSQYGRASDTFIRLEVRELRQLGHAVHTFSIRRPREPSQSDAVLTEQSRTIYVLDASPAALALAVLGCASAHPARTARALAAAWRLRAPGPRGTLWSLFYFVEAAYVARRVSRLGIQHLHNHIAHNSALVCMLAAMLAGVTWSMTVHGPHDLVDPARWSLEKTLAAASFSAFVSEFGRSQGMWHSPPGVWARFHVVRCGLDAAFLGRPATPVPARPRLVFVGRLAPEKGVSVLIDAAAKLAAAEVPFELVVIGDGPCREEMEDRVRAGGLEQRIRFLGWQSSERVREEILASRALVLPSFAEGLPIVLMEALALGRPVVATHVAGIPELVQHGTHGYLTAPGSAGMLCEAMRKVLSTPSHALERMGRAGAVRVRELHDATASVRVLERLFADVIRGGAGH